MKLRLKNRALLKGLPMTLHSVALRVCLILGLFLLPGLKAAAQDESGPPVLLCPPDFQVLAGANGFAKVTDLGTPTATSNDGEVDVSNDAPHSLRFPIGTNQVIWTATDTHGNSSTCVQSI